MKIEQFVVAYQAEQDRIRALLPEGFTSLRPVLRINAELRGEEAVPYLEFNTPVAADGKRGWLNITHWEGSSDQLTAIHQGSTVIFRTPFLEISFTGVGIEGSCPAERDNDGCFFLDLSPSLRPAEQIDAHKEFCDCRFQWSFSDDDAQGVSQGKTLPAYPTEPQIHYPRQPLTAPNAASIPCQQVLGSYRVSFERKERSHGL